MTKSKSWKELGVTSGDVPGFVVHTPGARYKVIDWEMVGKMYHIQCTTEEVCHILGLGSSILAKRCVAELGMTIGKFIEKHKVGGKMSLRRAQFEKAINGEDTSMLIWLGKQYLGQKEKAEIEIDVGGETFRSLKEIKQVIEADPAAMGGTIDVDAIEEADRDTKALPVPENHKVVL